MCNVNTSMAIALAMMRISISMGYIMRAVSNLLLQIVPFLPFRLCCCYSSHTSFLSTTHQHHLISCILSSVLWRVVSVPSRNRLHHHPILLCHHRHHHHHHQILLHHRLLLQLPLLLRLLWLAFWHHLTDDDIPIT
jgi:hypothetical protein